MAKHAAPVATVAKHAAKVPTPAGIAVRAGAKGARMAGGKLASRGEGRFADRSKSADTYGKHASSESSITNDESVKKGRRDETRDNSGNRRKTVYSSKRSPNIARQFQGSRSSRTRYIRYIGKDEQEVVGKLIGEYIAGVILILLSLPSTASDKGYGDSTAKIMWRFTGLTGAFFFLAILANSKAAKAAIWIGLAIDIAILYQGISLGVIKDITKMFVGKSLDGTQLGSDIESGKLNIVASSIPSGISDSGTPNSTTTPAPQPGG